MTTIGFDRNALGSLPAGWTAADSVTAFDDFSFGP